MDSRKTVLITAAAGGTGQFAVQVYFSDANSGKKLVCIHDALSLHQRIITCDLSFFANFPYGSNFCPRLVIPRF